MRVSVHKFHHEETVAWQRLQNNDRNFYGASGR
jgi:hypothetical protein